MKLSSNKIRLLREAIGAYNYPPVTYDFATERESIHLGMASVESLIQEQLLSADSNAVRDGLSNVLYWGYATQEGRQSDRVARFRAKVTKANLNNCIALFCNLDSLDPKSIGHRHIRELPEFGCATTGGTPAGRHRYCNLCLSIDRTKYDSHGQSIWRQPELNGTQLALETTDLPS